MTPDQEDQEAKWDIETVVLGQLQETARYKRPRAAIAGYETLIALGAFHMARCGPFHHLNELAWRGRPAVSAAAVKALIRARRAERRIPR